MGGLGCSDRARQGLTFDIAVPWEFSAFFSYFGERNDGWEKNGWMDARCLYCILGEKGTLKKHDGLTTFFQRNILLGKVRDIIICLEQKLWGTS